MLFCAVAAAAFLLGLGWHDLLARYSPPDEPEYEEPPNPEADARWRDLLWEVAHDEDAAAAYDELRRRAE